MASTYIKDETGNDQLLFVLPESSVFVEGALIPEISNLSHVNKRKTISSV